MPRRIVSMLVVLALGVQALLGAVPAGLPLCLGGGHQHQTEPAGAPCEYECAHAADLVAPGLAGDHAERCGCSDVRLAVTDAVVPGRVERDAPGAGDAGPEFATIEGACRAVASAVRVSARERATMPGGPVGPPIRCVRLQI